MAFFKVSNNRMDDSSFRTEPIKNYIKPVSRSQSPNPDYLMENETESLRLEVKTKPQAVRKQALWCGIKPGLRVLDAGCGPGKVTSILKEMIQPGGTILGVDYSEKRISHAKKHYGKKSGVEFQLHDLRDPLDSVGQFDLIWVRFVLEYNLLESREIVRNLTANLKPDGYLCLLDLDHNCLSHYQLPTKVEKVLFDLMAKLEKEYNFDPYSGRKLYSYLYELNYQNITVDVNTHNLIYGNIGKAELFNWTKKAEVASEKTRELFEKFPGSVDSFVTDFIEFFSDPKRFTYTPLILCKGMKPVMD